MKIVLSIIIAFLAFPAASLAAGFDCAHANRTLEVLICADTELSALDSQVGTAYRQMHGSSVQSEDQRAKQLNEQRQFLKARTEVCRIPPSFDLSESETAPVITCLKGLYTLRLNALKKQLAELEIQNSPSPSVATTAESAKNAEKAASALPTTQPPQDEGKALSSVADAQSTKQIVSRPVDTSKAPKPATFPPLPGSDNTTTMGGNEPIPGASFAQDQSIETDSPSESQRVYNCTMSEEAACHTSAVQDCIDEASSQPIGHTEHPIIFGVSDETGVVMIGKIGSGLRAYTRPFTNVNSDKVTVVVPVQPGGNSTNGWTFVLDRKLNKLFIAKIEQGTFVVGSLANAPSINLAT